MQMCKKRQMYRDDELLSWQRVKDLTFKCSFGCKFLIFYLQVFSDGVRRAMGDYENSIGLADHSVGNLD